MAANVSGAEPKSLFKTKPEQGLLLFLDEIIPWCIDDLARHTSEYSEEYIASLYLELVRQFLIDLYNEQKPAILLMQDAEIVEVGSAVEAQCTIRPAFGLEVVNVPVVVYENMAVRLNYTASSLPIEIIETHLRELEDTMNIGADFINNLINRT